MNFAIIGTNFISDWLILDNKKNEKFHAQAVYSRTMDRAKEFAAKHNIPDCYDSLEALAAADNIDAVYVASPTFAHAKQSIMMMKAGKHVLCEKPIASNEKEVREMFKVAEEQGVVLLEAMKSAFDPGFQAILDNLDKIGKIRRVTFEYCQYSSRYDKFKKGIIENAFKPELSNGSVMDVGVYCVHPLMKLLGKPDKIHGFTTKLHNGVDGQGTIICEYEKEGILAELLFAKITDAPVPSQIQGENGSMVIEEIPMINKIKIRHRDKTWEEIDVSKEDQINNMIFEVEEFVRLVENKESAAAHNQYSIWEMEVMDEARRQMGIVFPADL